MEFVVLYQNGAILATALEIDMSDDGNYVLYATDSSTGNITVIQYLGSDKKVADETVARIHATIKERFMRYSVDVHNKPILFDFT